MAYIHIRNVAYAFHALRAEVDKFKPLTREQFDTLVNKIENKG